MDAGDGDFGPQLRGAFDFTLVFEQGILSIAPSVLFLFAASARLASLVRTSSQVKTGYILWFKLSTIAVLFSLQLALLGLWASKWVPSRGVGVAATVLSLVDSLMLAVLTYPEHRRSVHPSALISGYLFLSVLLDLAQARSLFLRFDMTALAGVFVASVALKAVLLVLEEVPKTALLERLSAKEIGPEFTSGLVNRSFFWWLNSMFVRGYKAVIGMDDLQSIGRQFDSEQLLGQISHTWTDKRKSEKHGLLWATVSAFRFPLLAGIIPRLAFAGFTFAQPFLINRVISFVGQDGGEFDQDIAGGLIGATIIIYLGIAVTRGYYRHLTFQTITFVRGGLVSLIYEKSLRLDTAAIKDLAPVTLMSTDVDAIAQGGQMIHEIWANMIELGVGIFMLEWQIGGPCFLVLLPAVLGSFVTHFIGKYMGPARVTWNKGVQKRVGMTAVALNNMKGIKMMGLSKYMEETIQNFRVYEVDLGKKFRVWFGYLNVAGNTIEAMTPTIVLLAAIFWPRGDGDQSLGVAQAFTALAIVYIVSTPLTTLISCFPMLMTSVACFQRVQSFLLLEERKDYRQLVERQASRQSTPRSHGETGSEVELRNMAPEKQPINTPSSSYVVQFQNASFRAHDEAELLRDINFRVPTAAVSMLVGRVGCGKSSLLRAILGEGYITSGAVILQTDSLAYCDQTPWLRNISIRDNIVEKAHFDDAWYSEVIHACALDQDFELIPGGDSVLVGTGGVALSGGQKQRVTIARAVYARKDILLIDDAFSGLDNTTSSAVFTRLMGPNGLLRRERTTVVFATSSVHFLRHADFITMLDEGRIKHNQVKYEALDPSTWGSLEQGLFKQTSEAEDTEDDDPKPTEVKQAMVVTTKKPTDVNPNMKRMTGDTTLYKFYLSSVGPTLCILWLISVIAFIGLLKAPALWLRFWTEHGTGNDAGYYAGIYVALSVGSVIFVIPSFVGFVLILMPKSAKKLHLQLLQATIRAPLYFFTTTDSGETLNRFSQDMTLVDQQLPMCFLRVALDVMQVVFEMAIIASGAQYIAAVIPVGGICIYFLQKYYLRTSRQMRHLDLEAKSPLYTQFGETVAGLTTVRAFTWTKSFLRENHLLLDSSQKPYYLMYCIQRWLNVVLDLMVAGIAVVLVAFAVELRHTTSSGAIGLALLNILNFNTSLAMLVGSWTDMETSLGAIARIKDFLQQTPVEDKEGEAQLAPSGWPTRGEIEFNDITATYSAGLKPVLNNVSLKIEAGQKVALCGRTGSGKSSLVLTLLRLLELESGTIRIDGIDLSVLPRQTIRSMVTALPQDPVRLPGTVRKNLDPEGTIPNDADLIAALDKVSVWDAVAPRGGLDAEFDELGLSVGQQQLFCMARALLHRSAVFLLDEATSSVDPHTEIEVRRMLEDELKGCTVIEVAHRLDAVVDYDMVIVMDAGRPVEVGRPRELLARGGRFKNLWEGRSS